MTSIQRTFSPERVTSQFRVSATRNRFWLLGGQVTNPRGRHITLAAATQVPMPEGEIPMASAGVNGRFRRGRRG